MDITLEKGAETKRGRSKWLAVMSQMLKYAVLLLFVAIFIVPVFWMVSASLKTLQEI